MIGSHRFSWLVALALTASSCERAPQPPPPPADARVVATFDGGTVTLDDVDRWVLALPPDQRPPADEEPAAWMGRIVREQVLNRWLLAGADPAEHPDVAALARPALRRFLSDLYLQRTGVTVQAPTEAELRAAYAERRERFHQPARRMVFHIFRRVGPGDDRAEVRAAIESARRRLLDGEPFANVASDVSESQSRHNDGLLGWLRRDELPLELGEIVFGLPRGTPSEPVDAKDGVHLFLVAEIQEEARFSYEETVTRLAQELRRERATATLVDLAAELPAAPGDFRVDDAELQRLLDQGADSVPVLQTGDFHLTLGEFRNLLRQDPDATTSSKVALLDELEARERIYQHCQELDWAQQPDVQAQLEGFRSRELVGAERRVRFERWLNEDQEPLRAFYERHRQRFTGPLRIALRRLSLEPQSPADASSIMGRLERARSRLDAGELTLEELAAEIGGEIEDLGWVTTPQLGQLGRPAAGLAASLETGHASPPYLRGDRLELLLATGRREPEVLPYASVLDAVREAYVAQHGAEAYRRWVEAELEKAHFRLFEERLSRRDPVTRGPS